MGGDVLFRWVFMEETKVCQKVFYFFGWQAFSPSNKACRAQGGNQVFEFRSQDICCASKLKGTLVNIRLCGFKKGCLFGQKPTKFMKTLINIT